MKRGARLSLLLLYAIYHTYMYIHLCECLVMLLLVVRAICSGTLSVTHNGIRFVSLN